MYDEDIYRYLLHYGPSSLQDIFKHLTDMYGVTTHYTSMMDGVSVLFSRYIIDWVDDPQGRAGNTFLGLKQ